jgi:hypothetical protein
MPGSIINVGAPVPASGPSPVIIAALVTGLGAVVAGMFALSGALVNAWVNYGNAHLPDASSAPAPLMAAGPVDAGAELDSDVADAP